MNDIDGWVYYNHAFLPTVNPHEIPNMTPIENKSIWKKNKSGILARWISDFDNYNGEWYCCIKDSKFDINLLKSKRRNVVSNGIKNFDVKIINPNDFLQDIYVVQSKAFEVYPIKYRPNVTMETTTTEMNSLDKDSIVYGAFKKDNNLLCGYTIIKKQNNVIHLVAQKTVPEYERLQVNAALLYFIIQDYNDKLDKNFYISNGEKNILHETGFNEYLQKYFGFRKAACKLNIVYNPKYKTIIKILYPFRKVLKTLDSVGIIHKVNGVLKMEAIVRKQVKTEKKNKIL